MSVTTSALTKQDEQQRGGVARPTMVGLSKRGISVR